MGEIIKEEMKPLTGSRDGGCLVFVVHGGVIMAAMEAFARPARGYFSWQVKNGAGYLCKVQENREEPFGFELTDVAEISVL